MWRLVGAFCQLAPSSILAPPTPFSSFALAGAESTYQGGFLRLAPLLVTQHPGGQGPPPPRTNHRLAATPLCTHKPTRKSPLQTARTSPGAPEAPRQQPPPRGAGESAGLAAGSRREAPGRAPPGPAPPARARPPRRAAYLGAGAAAAHLPAANRKPNSGRGPSCRTLLCQRRSGRVAGAECATGQNGGMAFFFGGGDSSDPLGRAGCLRAGAGQMLYF